jgi:chromate reductase
MKILGISGSLRAASFNTLLLRAAAACAPASASLRLHAIGDLPLYDADLDTEAQAPEAARALKQAIGEADALLFATPEYNYSIPGGLKNAIDWASRPAYRSCLAGKPCGVLSASPGPIGGARAQAHLKLILGGCLAPVFPAPEFLVPGVADKFDGAGNLGDAATAERLQRYMQDFTVWAARQRRA